MHLGGSLKYQVGAAPLREIISDFGRVESSPLDEAMVAL
jgi:hypothetical protein